MGLRGPAAVPIEIKRARGNPGKRTLPKDAPTARLTGSLYRPDDLDAYAIETWERLIQMLGAQKILSDENYLIVAHIARVESRRHAAQVLINSISSLQKISAAKAAKLRAAMRVVRDCEAQMRPLLREAGMTPSSRGSVSAIQAVDKKADDPWARLG